MLIMVLHPMLLTRLLTTFIFIIVASVTLTFLVQEAERKDLVGATAAYAPVLVVFVGTGEDSTSSDMRNWVIGVVVAGSILGTFYLLYLLRIISVLQADYYESVPIPEPGLRKPWEPLDQEEWGRTLSSGPI